MCLHWGRALVDADSSSGMASLFVARQLLDGGKGLARRRAALHIGASECQRVAKRVGPRGWDGTVAPEELAYRG